MFPGRQVSPGGIFLPSALKVRRPSFKDVRRFRTM